MNEFPSTTDIITALKQSGYLMEQQVATQLESLDLHVWTNWAYEDVDEGKSREIDVRAIKMVARNEQKKIAAYLEIIAECKNNSYPLVFVERAKNATDGLYPPEEMVFPIAHYQETRRITKNSTQTRNKDAFFHLGFDQVHYDFLTEKKAVQFCRITRQGKNWQANHGGLYDSIFYPISKALMSRKSEITTGSSPSEWRYFWFFVPMVVTSGDIYCIDSTSANPVPKRTNSVTFKREIRSDKVQGTFSVEFILQGHLEHFFTNRVQPIVRRIVDLTMNEADYLLSVTIPWKD